MRKFGLPKQYKNNKDSIYPNSLMEVDVNRCLWVLTISALQTSIGDFCDFSGVVEFVVRLENDCFFVLYSFGNENKYKKIHYNLQNSFGICVTQIFINQISS